MVATRSSTRKAAEPPKPLAAPPKRAPKKAAAPAPAKRTTRATAQKTEPVSPLKKPAKKPKAGNAAAKRAPRKKAAAEKVASPAQENPFADFPHYPSTPAHIQVPEPVQEVQEASPVVATQPEVAMPVFAVPELAPAQQASSSMSSTSPLKSAMRSPEKRDATGEKKAVAWTPRASSIIFDDSLLVKDGPLTGCVVYVDVHDRDGVNKNHLFESLVEELGGEVMRSWLSNSTTNITHVIFMGGSLATLQKVAATNGTVKCVQLGWAMESEKRKKRMPENEYRVDVAAAMAKFPAVTTNTPSPKKISKIAYTPARTPGQVFAKNPTPPVQQDNDPSFQFSREFLLNYVPPSIVPSTPGSSIFNKTLSYFDLDEEKENSAPSPIANPVQQTCPPKPQTHLPWLKQTPVRPINFAPMTAVRRGPAPGAFDVMRPYTAQKRKREFGGITMATPKKLRLT
ncbi:hypothetical protein K491DRAFT_713430 [Lophiostoma macrostomum CBS 122681]|uniref:BRCT domain-containing protein n=1 Tax=Lophiostoma macrostomum CBS 122681 TaxID=1314788 RepID=A0A6A6TER7_9PLEO|nr:hypothetical protein K491DRAFT_713430 [Lophiostoma macrostomum CBS 122681]